MKKSNLSQWRKDLRNRIVLSLKLLFRDQGTLILFFVSVLCFFLICNSLNQAADTKSKIPIGIVNLDTIDSNGVIIPSDASSSLICNLNKVEAFRVILGDFDELKKRLSQNEIYCFYVIESGYEKKIKASELTHLITVYRKKGDDSVPLLSDIFAGEMINQICIEKSASRYASLFKEDKWGAKESYLQYVNDLKEREDILFRFDIELSDIELNNTEFSNTEHKTNIYEKLETSLLYRQIVAGIFAILLSFLIMFSYTYVCMEREQGLQKRLKLTVAKKGTAELGWMISVLLLAMVLSIVFVSCVCYSIGLPQVFFKLLCLSFLFALMIAFIFAFISKVVTHFLGYQLVGALVVFVLGASGFLSMIVGILNTDFLNVFKFTPNGWFIEKFVDIIINT